MRFMNPSALWLLLGVPVLIIIWLIKPHHENKRVSSSYIWKLSDRFMKKRMPFTDLARWLVFLLQLMVIIGGSLIAAKPVIGHGGKVDYLVILDASASMQTETESGITRFESAVKQIKELAKETSDGHTLTVIAAGDKTEYIISEGSSRREVSAALDGYKCGWGGSAFSEAMTLAQLFVYEHPSAEVTLFTDQKVAVADGVNTVIVSDESWNASLTDLSAVSEGIGGSEISAVLTSWGRDETITVGLSVNGKLIYGGNYDCAADQPVRVSFAVSDMSAVSSVEISMDPGDALEADNRIVYHQDSGQTCDSVLFSDTPLYLSSALSAINRGAADVLPAADMRSTVVAGEYDLYILESCASESYPVLGTIFLVNPTEFPDGLTVLGESDEPGTLIASAASNRYRERLLSNVRLDGVSVSRHTVLDASDDWITICSVGEDPVMLIKTNGIGQATIVLAFDLHDSNLPLKSDFVSMIRNVINTAVPPLVDRQIVTVGESLTVTLPQTAPHLTVISPDGSSSVFEYESEARYTASLPGSYRVECEDHETGFFAVIPPDEGHEQTIDSLSLSRDLSLPPDSAEEARSGLWKTVAMIILILFLAEWGLYIYEQY